MCPACAAAAGTHDSETTATASFVSQMEFGLEHDDVVLSKIFVPSTGTVAQAEKTVLAEACQKDKAVGRHNHAGN